MPYCLPHAAQNLSAIAISVGDRCSSCMSSLYNLMSSLRRYGYNKDFTSSDSASTALPGSYSQAKRVAFWRGTLEGAINTCVGAERPMSARS